MRVDTLSPLLVLSSRIVNVTLKKRLNKDVSWYATLSGIVPLHSLVLPFKHGHNMLLSCHVTLSLVVLYNILAFASSVFISPLYSCLAYSYVTQSLS